MTQRYQTHVEGRLLVTISTSNSLFARICFFVLTYIFVPLNAMASVVWPAPKDHRTPVPRDIKRKFLVRTYEEEAGIQVHEITPRGLESPSTRVVYIPGTGYSQPAHRQHIRFCAEVLATELKATIVIVLHPFARTGGRAHIVWPAIADIYKKVAESTGPDTRIILGGDSSGSSLALSIAQHAAAEAGTRSPDTVLLICPSPVFMLTEDSTRTEKEAQDPLQEIAGTNQVHEHWIEGSGWRGDDPRLSPLYGDFGALEKADTKICCVVAGRDILEPDAQLLKGQCIEGGLEGRWLVEENMFHVFPLTWTYGLPEAKNTVAWLVKSLKA